MVEKANFIVALKNKISGPGRAAARSIQGVGKGLRSIGRVSDGLDNMVDRLDRVAQKRGILVNFRKQLRANAIQAKAGEGLFRVFARTVGQNLQGAARLGRRGLKRLSGGVDALSSKLLRAAKSTGILLGAATGLAAFLVTKGVVGAAEFAESSRLALSNLTGSAQLGEQAFQKSIALAGTYGLKVQATTKQIIKLRAAQFTIGESLKLVKLTTDLRALGATALEVSSAIRAITQIKAKGRLQAEELVGQLAEAGIATTLVYEALSKRLGKSQDDIRKLITAGKISADLGIAAISDAILKKANIKEAGQAGRQFADSTIGGLIGRLAAAPQILFLRASEASSSVAPKFKEIVRDLTSFIDGISPRGLADVATNILEIVRQGIPLIKEFAAGFGEGFGDILKSLGGGGDQEQLAKGVRQLGRDIAKVVELGIRGSKVVLRLVSSLVGPVGRTATAVGLLSLAFLRVTSAVGKIAILFGVTAKAGTIGAGFVAFGKALKPVISLLGRLPAAFAAIASAAKTVGTAIAALAASATAIAASFAAIGIAAAALSFKFREELAVQFLKAFDFFFGIGQQIGQGLINGLTSALTFALPSVVSTLNKVVNTAKSVLGITSPSKVFEKIGQQSAQGFNLGLQDRSAQRAATVNGLVSPGGSMMGGGMAPRIVAPMTFNFNGDASTGDTGRMTDAVAQGVQKGIRGAFTTAPQGA